MPSRSRPGRRRVGAVLAEDADPHVDQPGVEVIGTEIPLLHGAGPEVLAHHVGLGRQPAEQLLALGRPQVAGGAPPAPPLDRPEQRVAGPPLVAVSTKGPMVRMKSPPPGSSTLMTSAPSSPRSPAQNGAEIRVPTSRTRMPVQRTVGGVGPASTGVGLLRAQRPADPRGPGRRRPPSSRSAALRSSRACGRGGGVVHPVVGHEVVLPRVRLAHEVGGVVERVLHHLGGDRRNQRDAFGQGPGPLDSSARGTTRLTSPRRHASWASMMSPVRGTPWPCGCRAPRARPAARPRRRSSAAPGWRSWRRRRPR